MSEDPNPIKTAPLKSYVKDQSDLRAGSDAIDELEAELLYLTRILWLEASQRAEERGRKTVQKQDLSSAYDDLFEPHELLMEAQEDISGLADRLEDTADRSPIFKNWSSYEE